MMGPLCLCMTTVMLMWFGLVGTACVLNRAVTLLGHGTHRVPSSNKLWFSTNEFCFFLSSRDYDSYSVRVSRKRITRTNKCASCTCVNELLTSVFSYVKKN
jgi:hypothetical protein